MVQIPDPKAVNQRGHVHVHSQERQGLLDTDEQLTYILSKMLKGRVSATEPTHDGSQEADELWVQK
jgi:hypothetical protein